MKGVWKRLGKELVKITFAAALFCSGFSGKTMGAELGNTGDAQSLLDGWDVEEIQQFLNSSEEAEPLSFQKLMSDLMSGNLDEVMSEAGKSIENALFSQVKKGGGMMGQVLALGLIGAVFTVFSGAFNGSQVSEAGFFVTYLLLFTFLAASFLTSMEIAVNLAGKIMDFMKVLMPSYFLAAAFAGNTISSVVLYEGTFGMVAAAELLVLKFLLPTVKMYVLLVLAGHIAREELLTKLTDLLGKVVSWTLKTALGLMMGVHLIQGMVLPYADAVKQGGVRRLVEVIPGIGQGAGAVTQMVLGSGVLIKNTIGAAGVVCIAVMAAVPFLKLAVFMVLYHGTAAVLQPVCDKRIVSCISGVAEGNKMLLEITAFLLLLFVLTIAVLCISTNASYYGG